MSIHEFTLLHFYLADMPLTRRVLSRGVERRGNCFAWSHR